MDLNEDQKAAIIGALNSKFGDGLPLCPITRDSHWEVGTKLALIPAAGGLKASVLSGHVYPCVAMFCKTCGFTALFNLFTLGIAEKLGFAVEETANVSE